MSNIRIFTTAEDEKIIDRILKDLNKRGTIGKLHKWHALRWALAASFQLPFAQNLTREDKEGPRDGGEYRPDQVTGEGKGAENLTLSVRSILSVQHARDCFDPNVGDDWFKFLLQYHISRGLTEIDNNWREDERFASYLLRAFGHLARAAGDPDAPASIERLQVALKEIGIQAEVRPELRTGPRLTRYTLVTRANDIDRLQKGLDKLCAALGYLPGELTLEFLRNSEQALDIPRPERDWIRHTTTDLLRWLSDAPSTLKLPMCPGVDTMGNPVWLDLADAPHLMIAGTTGSGKSVCLHALLCSLLLKAPMGRVEFVLIDPKRVELRPYRLLPNLRGGARGATRSKDPAARVLEDALPGMKSSGVLSEGEEIRAALDNLIQEMDARYKFFSHSDARDLDSASSAGEQFPRIIVVVEELADLVLRLPGAQDLLLKLAQTGRAAGIHLLLSTQRPDAETFRGLLRSNVPTRIALAVQKSSESRIILDEDGAERLLKPGDMLIKRPGEKLRRVHGVYISEDDVARTVRELRKRSEQ